MFLPLKIIPDYHLFVFFADTIAFKHDAFY